MTYSDTINLLIEHHKRLIEKLESERKSQKSEDIVKKLEATRELIAGYEFRLVKKNA